MNWEAFAQVIVWAAFIISVVTALLSGFALLEDAYPPRRWAWVFAISTVVAIITLAVTYGMGWLR